MRDFRLYIGVDKYGKMTVHQKEQLDLIVSKLRDCRINTFWIIDDTKITGWQILSILHGIHSACKNRGVIIHANLFADNKTVTLVARSIMGHVPIVLYNNERDNEADYACLKYMNYPEGCMFNSCLGNTLYLRQDDEISVCPRTNDIRLNRLRNGSSISSVFDTDEFKQLLLQQIEKRNRCKNGCQLFSVCHGGCPMQGYSRSCTIQKRVEQLILSEESVREQELKKLASLYRG